MKHVLQNADCRIELDPLGAELQSLQIANKERVWTASPKWWARHSPVLFPVVGRCREDRIQIDGQFFPMSQHGFARDTEFVSQEKTEKSVLFRLFDTGETLQQFPFPFELSIRYTALKKGVHVSYEVVNPGNRSLPFALGAHPGFLLPESGFDKLTLEFSEEEQLSRHLLKSGLFSGETEHLGNGKTLELRSDLFDKDAIVFKGIRNRKLQVSDNTDFSLRMEFGGFEDLGIWTKAGCTEFLCLEPWYGFADSETGPDELSERPGIHLLEPGQSFEAFWQAEWTDGSY